MYIFSKLTSFISCLYIFVLFSSWFLCPFYSHLSLSSRKLNRNVYGLASMAVSRRTQVRKEENHMQTLASYFSLYSDFIGNEFMMESSLFQFRFFILFCKLIFITCRQGLIHLHESAISEKLTIDGLFSSIRRNTKSFISAPSHVLTFFLFMCEHLSLWLNFQRTRLRLILFVI